MERTSLLKCSSGQRTTPRRHGRKVRHGCERGPLSRSVLGDAAWLPLRPRAFDAVVCRHVVWALTDIDAALGQWTGLLRPGGSLVLIEGRWSTSGGLEAHEVTSALAHLGRPATVKRLGDERLWGRKIEDDRYLILS